MSGEQAVARLIESLEGEGVPYMLERWTAEHGTADLLDQLCREAGSER